MIETIPKNLIPIGVQEAIASELLWYQGDLSLLTWPKASVIGTRDVSTEGVVRTKKITRILVENGFCVVSGLALGVDSVAHSQAIAENGKTIAVLGTPVDEYYPRDNKELQKTISEKGLLISQFAKGETVHTYNFPKRNGLMAALSEITIVIEAGEKSGVRYQVDAAIKYNKPVAILRSLSSLPFDWIRKILDSNLSLIIDNPEDLIVVLNQIKNGTFESSIKGKSKESDKQGDLFTFKTSEEKISTRESSLSRTEMEHADIKLDDKPIKIGFWNNCAQALKRFLRIFSLRGDK